MQLIILLITLLPIFFLLSYLWIYLIEVPYFQGFLDCYKETYGETEFTSMVSPVSFSEYYKKVIWENGCKELKYIPKRMYFLFIFVSLCEFISAFHFFCTKDEEFNTFSWDKKIIIYLWHIFEFLFNLGLFFLSVCFLLTLVLNIFHYFPILGGMLLIFFLLWLIS